MIGLKECTKNLHLIFLFTLISTLVNSQSPCELIKTYSLAVCDGNKTESLKILEEFRQLYPTDSLIDDVNLSVAETYFNNGEIEKSKVVAIEIINSKTALYKRGSQVCPIFYNSTECRRALYIVDDFREIKYKACILLHKILMKEKDFYKALYYLNLATTDFASYYWAGYPSHNWHLDSQLDYSVVYESIGAYDKAIDAIAPYMLRSPVIDRMIFLLKKYKNFDSIRNLLQNVDSLISVDYGVVSENPKVTDEYDKQTNRVLRSTAVEEYGYISYWDFLGQHFRMSSTNEYKTKKRKGKLHYNETIERLVKEAKQYIKETAIYKAIMERVQKAGLCPKTGMLHIRNNKIN